MSHLDLFFEAIDLTVLNGWGLTETSPVLCCRLSDAHQNVRGTVGYPIPDTEIRIVDPDSTRDVPDGTPGLVLARGPGVMQGYYRSPEETERVMLEGGWFSTGTAVWFFASFFTLVSRGLWMESAFWCERKPDVRKHCSDGTPQGHHCVEQRRERRTTAHRGYLSL